LSREARAVRAVLGDAPGVQVVVSGMGQAAARAAAKKWVPLVRAVVVCGVAGGTGGAAETGDVVVASVVVDGAGAALPGWVTAVDVPGAITGVVASVESPVDSAEERQRLRDAGTLAVETEAAAWVAAGAAHGVSVSVVRVVLDTPQRPLGPLATLVPEGARGASPLRVATLVLRPASWRPLAQTGALAARCERRMAMAVASVCRS
jgi:nucleoside phosphorylase